MLPFFPFGTIFSLSEIPVLPGATKDVPSEIHDSLYSMMRTLDAITNHHQIEYSIAFGTLLGAVREKRIIPWDDDIDLYMKTKDLSKLRRVNLSPYTLDYRDHIWRFNLLGKDYPYIDIFEVREERGMMVFVEEENRKRWPQCSIKVEDIYPLKTYTLGTLKLQGPWNSKVILTKNYGSDYMTPKYSRPHMK
jgi:phosphorylcholine metabolism protein LicD